MSLDEAWKAKARHLAWEVREWERSYELIEEVLHHELERNRKLTEALDRFIEQQERELADLKRLYRVHDYMEKAGDEAGEPATDTDRKAEGDPKG